MVLLDKMKTKAILAKEAVSLVKRMHEIEDQTSEEYQECLDKMKQIVLLRDNKNESKTADQIAVEVIKLIGVIGTLLIVIYHEDIANEVLGGKAFQIWNSRAKI